MPLEQRAIVVHRTGLEPAKDTLKGCWPIHLPSGDQVVWVGGIEPPASGFQNRPSTADITPS